jgi:hypothetical protein
MSSWNAKSQNFEWVTTIGGSTFEGGRSVTIDNQGSVYIAGSFTGTVDFNPGPNIFNLTSAGGNDIFVCKLDSSRNFVWAKSMGGTATNDIVNEVIKTFFNSKKKLRYL